jgi:hypothetical protein
MISENDRSDKPEIHKDWTRGDEREAILLYGPESECALDVAAGRERERERERESVCGKIGAANEKEVTGAAAAYRA